MGDDTNWGCGPAGCLVILIILFLVGAFIANKQGMDVSEMFRNFMDIFR